MALITLQELGDHVGKTLTGDKRAEAIVASVNEQVTNYIGRLFGVPNGGQEVTEVLDYSPIVFLKYLDIQSIVELKIDKKIRTDGTYKLNKSIGRIILSSADSPVVSTKVGMDAIEITYKAGLTTVPADLKLACLQIASDALNRKDSDASAGSLAGVSSASVGGLNISFGAGSSSDATQAQDGSHNVGSYIATLNYYRRRRVS